VSDESPAPKKRSRKLYVLWGVALTLLLAAGAFCWAVVVPVWQVHRVLTPGAEVVTTEDSIERLGGPREAADRLSLYIRMPRQLASHKLHAAYLLRHCGDSAVAGLTRSLRDGDPEVRRAAAYGLWSIVCAAEERFRDRPLDDTSDSCSLLAERRAYLDKVARQAVPALARTLEEDDTSYVRYAAALAMQAFAHCPDECVPALTKSLEDRDPKVRSRSAWTLGGLPGTGSVIVLRSRTDHGAGREL